MKKVKITPVKGMRDILPQESFLREEVTQTIKKTYLSYGYAFIETPSLESLDLLMRGEGGENEKLIFNILKRGEKLRLQEDALIKDICDYGLRFDLTVPLSRYYANNRQALPKVFKAMQIAPVWRAERPQKGRFRQFYQCDIDIIGEKSVAAELDLMTATTEAIEKLGLKDFKVLINDRHILTALLERCGFEKESYDTVLIILDKLDKIEKEGVQNELLRGGFEEEKVQTLMMLLEKATSLEELKEELKGEEVEKSIEHLEMIMHTLKGKGGSFEVLFSISLVRGMSYYTGTIYEVIYKEYPFSIAGGGRYDEMIGHLINEKIPACGFSIGFERIITILEEEKRGIETTKEKIAILLDSPKAYPKALKTAQEYREKGVSVSIYVTPKNMKNFLESLRTLAFTHFLFYKEEGSELKPLA